MLPRRYRQWIEDLPSGADDALVRSVISRIANWNEPTEQTQLVRYSQIRSYLRLRKPQWVGLVREPPGLIDRVAKARQESLESRDNLYVDVASVQAVMYGRESKHYERRVAFLQLVSGRRISEIHGELNCTRFFEHGDGLASNSLCKKRGDKQLHTFPLLPAITPTEFLEELAVLRRAIRHLPLSTVTAATNEYLKGINPEFTSHKLRGIYANILWTLDGMRAMKTAFIKRVLCLESLPVAIHYSSYVLADDYLS